MQYLIRKHTLNGGAVLAGYHSAMLTSSSSYAGVTARDAKQQWVTVATRLCFATVERTTLLELFIIT